MTARTTPPFRADMVGSLLRSAPVKEAREKKAAGTISDAELAAIEDREIADLVKKQVAVGLQAVTDGEFRRSFWHFDFLENLDGVIGVETEGIAFAGVTTKGHGVRVKGKIDFTEAHPHLAHFRFLKSVTPAGHVAKMTIPSPSMLHYRGGRKAVEFGAYREKDAYYADLGAAYAKAIKAFYDAGCRYLQLDDTSLSYLCDPAQRQMLAERGDDPDRLIHVYRDIINTATAAKPADMVITTHTCRGNFKSTFIASGATAPKPERSDVTALRPAVPRERKYMERIAELHGKGVVRPQHVTLFELAKACEALGVSAARHFKGKLVLKVR